MKYTSALRNWWPVTRCTQARAALTLSAASTPSRQPMAVPMTPMKVPWTMNTAMICRGVAPRVRRMAMSDFLSVTTITRVETILKAATATISSRSRPIMVFSMPMAW